MQEKKIFSNNLNYLMEKHGKNQTDLINDLGVNKSTISTWCNGIKMPRMGTIQTLADYFGVMKSDLIEEKPVQEDELTEKQKMLIEKVRTLDPQQLDAFDKMLDAFLSSRGK